MENIENSKAEKRESRLLSLALLVVVLAVGVLAIVGFCFMNKPDELLEGQADATSVRISGKLPGRVATFYVKEGDMVKAGDTLVHITSSLVEARLQQAQAMQNVARAGNRKVDAGTRPQIIQTARDMLAQAQAAREIAKKTYDRMENLCNQGVVSKQKRDEAKAAYDASVAAVGAAQSQLDLAIAGAQQEDKEAASSMVNASSAGVREVEAILEDQYLLAPCDGQIDQIYPQVGELVSLGAPIMSLLKVDDKWVTFNVREEELPAMKLGDTLTVKVPGMEMKEVKARIYYVRDLGTYATWRATKATGQWDSRTFEVKARPLEAQPDLRPGMTVLLKKRK